MRPTAPQDYVGSGAQYRQYVLHLRLTLDEGRHPNQRARPARGMQRLGEGTRENSERLIAPGTIVIRAPVQCGVETMDETSSSNDESPRSQSIKTSAIHS